MDAADKSRPPKLPPRKQSTQASTPGSPAAARRASTQAGGNGAARPPKLGPRKSSSQVPTDGKSSSQTPDRRPSTQAPVDRNATPTPQRRGMDRRPSESRDATPTPQKRQPNNAPKESSASSPAPKLGPRKPSAQPQSGGGENKPQAQKSQGENAQPDKQQATKAKTETPQTEKTSTAKQSAERPQAQRAPSGRPQAQRASSGRPQPQRAQSGKQQQGDGAASKPTALSGVPKLGPRSDTQGDKGQQNKNKFETSLTTILNTRQRTQLVILLAAVTASMRDSVSSYFDAMAASSSNLRKSSSMTEDEKIMNPDVDPGSADVGALDKERKAVAKWEKECSAEKMNELKEAAEEWFDNWRETVIGRVGEVLNSAKEAKDEIESKEAKEMKPSSKTPDDKKIDEENEGSIGDGEANEDADAMIKEMYPAVRTQLADMDEEKRIMILHSVLLLLLSTEHYFSASRVLLLYLVSSLKLSLDTLKKDEEKTAHGLLESAKELSASDEAKKKAALNEKARKWKVGLASVAGAAIVGVTGGMAAPLVAAGVSSVMGGLGLGATTAATYLGSVAGSSMVVGSLFGAYGGRMTGQMMDNYAKDVDDFGFIPVHAQKGNLMQLKEKGEKAEADAGKKDPSSRRLRVTIGISGWLTEREEIAKPWSVLSNGSEAFALRWELEALMNLGNAMTELMQSAAWGYAQKQVIAQTIFAELTAAMWPLAMVKVARVIDNPFSVAKSRAEKAGEVLADALINHAQGERPVNLVGYSLGARVIYSCLLSLAERKAFGLIENVVMIGAPVPATGAQWRRMRAVVGSRLVNVFSENDYILKFLYRTGSAQYRIAGLQAVAGVSGVENVDVSQSVNGHLRYRFMVGKILRILGFEDLDMKEVEKEEEALEKMDEDERKRIEDLKNKIPGRKSNDQGDDGDNDMSEADAEKEASEMQKNVEEKTQQSMMQRGAELLHLRNYNAGQMAQDVQNMTAQDFGEKARAGGEVASSYLTYMKSKMPSRKSQAETGQAKDSTKADSKDEQPKDDNSKEQDSKAETQEKGKAKEEQSEEEAKEGAPSQNDETDESNQQSYLSMASERFHVIKSAAGKRFSKEQDHQESESVSGKTETTTTAGGYSDVTPSSPDSYGGNGDSTQSFQHINAEDAPEEGSQESTQQGTEQDADQSEAQHETSAATEKEPEKAAEKDTDNDKLDASESSNQSKVEDTQKSSKEGAGERASESGPSTGQGDAQANEK